ncbi:phage tail protein [Vibrio fluvialis]|nr:phage tail protein [Vibrio fluvialis]
MADENTDLRCYLTNAGIAAENNSIQLNRSLNVVDMVFGSGLLPDASDPRAQTAMISEEYAVPCAMLFDAESPTLLVFKGDLPADVGGFHINEVGIRLEDGTIYGYARGKGDYKPTLEQGATDSVRYAVEMYTENADIVVAKIDLSSVYADYEDIEATKKYADDKDAAHKAEVNPHPQYALGTELATVSQKLSTLTPNTFIKAETSAPAFMVSGGQLKTATALTISVGGVTVTHAANEVISTPVLLVGVDYAIYATADGLVVSNNFTVPDGYTAENSRRVGGFHYGNNEFKDYSFYDLHFRPTCKDPRGMVIDISGSRFWNDIYLLNSTPDALGTSAYNAQIADGSSPCKIPALWGGDGTAQYSNLTQYIAAEVLAAYGKRLPSHDEFEILALGSTPGYAVGADPVTTKFDVNARSKNGSEQVSGHLWQWGKDVWDRGNGINNYAWEAEDTNGQGQVYEAGTQAVGAVLLGASWDDSGYAGARASLWSSEPWSSILNVGTRGLCDHLLHV